jgi:predicted MFS family arabinose efflux permease
MMLLLAAAARGLALFVPISPVSALLLLAAMGITSYALTNLLLTAVPLLYAHLGTSLVAGLMDAVHSIGGAIGSTLVGVLLGQGGWSLVFGAWLLLPLLAMVVIFLVSPADKLKRTMPVH